MPGHNHAMNRSDLQNLATIRLRDAEVLLDNGRYDGAYYLLGYVIECALKACIAKQTKEFDFPDQRRVSDSYTHDLNRLLNLSGLSQEYQRESKINPAFADNWNIVKEWKESKRYESGIGEATARQFNSAVVDSTNGVLPWLQKWW